MVPKIMSGFGVFHGDIQIDSGNIRNDVFKFPARWDGQVLTNSNSFLKPIGRVITPMYPINSFINVNVGMDNKASAGHDLMGTNYIIPILSPFAKNY